MIRVCFLTPSLGYGGAQMMLVKLLSRLDRNMFAPEVISLTEFIPLAERLKDLDVNVRVLGMKLGRPDPTKLLKLASWLRTSSPDLLQTWMYHADLIGGLAAIMSGGIPVVWNIRHSDLNPNADKLMTRWTARACARLSHRIPRRIICCAETARDIHVKIGYAADKIEIIPNGFDLSSFYPDPAARARIREELGLGIDDFVIGLAARFHPQKDHRGFVKAAAMFADRCPGARFVLCGDEVTQENRELVSWLEETGLPERFLLLGRRSDMPAVTAAFDIACSSSASGEAFSNTLGEAMACGVPCVATHVGDAAQIIGETGLIVPPGEPSALVAAWEKVFEFGAPGRQALGIRARQRVMENFSLEKVTTRYETLFRNVLECSGHDEGREQWRAC